MSDLVTFAIEATFAAVFVFAVGTWWRRRDPLSRDVVLLFTSMMAVFALGIVGLVVGPPPPVLTSIAIVLLLGQPVTVVWLVARIHPVPRTALGAVIAGWLLTAIPLAALGADSPGPVLVATVIVFVVSELAGAWLLATAATRRAGASAARLWLAAAATALFAIAILAAGSGSATGAARDATGTIAQLAGLAAAVGYLVAFATPPVLRHLWHSHTAYLGLQRLLAVSGGADEVWRELARLARGSTGSVAVAVIESDSAGRPRVAAIDGLPHSLIGSALDDVPESSDVGLPIDEAPILGDAGRAVGARMMQTVPLVPGSDLPMLILLSSHRLLFADEDRRLLAALGLQAANLAEQRRLAAELSATVETVRAASQAKSDFLASMSHELRTPLNAIVGFSDLILHETPGPDGSISVPAEWIEHIHRGGVHLVELINDVLDLSKVEAGRLDLDLEPIDVLSAVTESAAGLRPLADRKRHTVEVDIEDVRVIADRGRFRQVLYNLLSNAIKFTPDGGRIAIEGRRVGDELHLAVIDSGVGIAPEHRELVFEEFRQVGGGSQRQQGTGLGLALTKRLVEAQHGRIELESTVDVGSRFTVVLPLAARSDEPDVVQRPDADTSVEADEDARSLTTLPATGAGSLLVVEDDPGAARLLRAYLEPVGYRVLVVPDGETALSRIAAERPSAVLLDVLLPGIDGWEVLRRLKADANLRDIPVVIVTIVDEREVGFALGAADYLIKPIDRDALLASLGRLRLTTPPPASRRSVVAIDDEPAVLDQLEEMLRPAGFDLVRATSGRDGVTATRRVLPDLVICDLVIPDLDGFAIVGELKSDPATTEIPIIILTGHDLTTADKARLNGNVRAIVTKGVDAQGGLSAWLAEVRQGRTAARV